MKNQSRAGALKPEDIGKAGYRIVNGHIVAIDERVQEIVSEQMMRIAEISVERGEQLARASEPSPAPKAK